MSGRERSTSSGLNSSSNEGTRLRSRSIAAVATGGQRTSAGSGFCSAAASVGSVGDELDLTAIESEVRSELDAAFAYRETVLKVSRPIVQNSSKAIRALHRGDVGTAASLLAETRVMVIDATAAATNAPINLDPILYDAIKEFAEAELTAALLAGRPLPLPSDLGMHAVPYLKGLGEAVGEQRRRLLDQLRAGDLEDAERTFDDMEQIHDLLTALDYPDGMTSGLRRTTDVARALIERSRADLTSTIVQERLRRQLSDTAE
jgi:translin